MDGLPRWVAADNPHESYLFRGGTGLVQETEELMSDAKDPDVLDAGLIGCAQAVEH